jgi:hypothetical protein
MHTRKVKNKSISNFTQLTNRDEIEGQFRHMKNFRKRKGRCTNSAYIFNIHSGAISGANQ